MMPGPVKISSTGLSGSIFSKLPCVWFRIEVTGVLDSRRGEGFHSTTFVQTTPVGWSRTLVAATWSIHFGMPG